MKNRIIGSLLTVSAAVLFCGSRIAASASDGNIARTDRAMVSDAEMNVVPAEVASLPGTADEDGKEVKYYDAAQFPLFGKCVSDTLSPRYERLPYYMEEEVRPEVWTLSRASAGLYVRFRSNTTSVSVRWTSTFRNSMYNMTDVGVRGLDLYAFSDGRWQYCGVANPKKQEEGDVMAKDMTPQEREYMLYLSLYDGLQSLEIGVDADAQIGQPLLDSPRSGSQVVMYGTSILQGCSATRPGMAHSNILARTLDMEVINLGFSGHARLDLEIARLMAQVKNPALYILDNVPNSSPEMIRERGEAFFRILRDAHPDVPVIFVEDPAFPSGNFDAGSKKGVMAKNEAEKELFTRLVEAGEENIYYVPSEGMIGYDGEATADGSHFSDMGMVRYVEHILPTVLKALAYGK